MHSRDRRLKPRRTCKALGRFILGSKTGAHYLHTTYNIGTSLALHSFLKIHDGGAWF